MTDILSYSTTSLYKQKIRTELQHMRDSLSSSRREEAAQQFFEAFCKTSHHYILSFFSFRSEISTHYLNKKWAKEGRLLLPRVTGKKIKIYLVSSYEQLIVNSLGIGEPDPALCKEIKEENIEFVLVPGLCFDKANYRIGYGKGFYDRFLLQMPHALQVGIGFKEQLCEELPKEEHDLPLSKIALF